MALPVAPEQGRSSSALTAAGADVSYLDIESDAGHDAFLVEVDTMTRLLGSFMDRLAREEGMAETRDDDRA